MISTAQRTELIELYVATFNRAPDSAGLAYWANELDTGKMTLTSIANSFMVQPETVAKYPSWMTTEQFVDAVYTNLFNRAADADGKAYWVDQLTKGAVSKSNFILAAINGAKASTGSADDKAILTNKTTMGEYVAVTLGSNLATVSLASITKDASSVDALKTILNTEAAESRVLTTAQDTIDGTDANEVFRGVAGSAVGTQDQTTLNSSDIIDGGNGTDTLIINMTGGNYNGGARIKNIETLQIGTNDVVARTFDYNVNMSSNEVTEVNTIRYDQINTGESLTVANITKSASSNTAIPTLLWDNEAGSTAGTIAANFRTSTVDGASTLNVQLDDVSASVGNMATGVLNIAAGIETINVNSQGTTANTLNNAATTAVDGTAADLVSSSATANSLTKVVLTGAQNIGKAATVVTTTTDNDYGYTNRAIGSDLGRDNATAGVSATASNLLSVANSVTEVDASAMTGSANVRFTELANGTATNVTFKGGSANDYVEFGKGAVTATGGAGNDTFAFITTLNSVTNSSFTSDDNLTGGTGTDTIQLGVDGTSTYTIGTSEFASKTGIDALDVRGLTNTITLGSSIVAAADAGKFTVYTDRVSQTSDTSSANPTGTAATTAEDNMVTTLDLRQLSGNTIKLVGGSGSDRVVMSDSTFVSGMELNGGTQGATSTTGDYDTITVVDSAVIDRNDLANVAGFEGLVLVESGTGNNTFRIDVTEAFLLANTASSNATSTDANDTVFQIGTATGSNGNALDAGDTVVIDVTDLYTTNNNTEKASLAGRAIDVTSLTNAGVTVNYAYNNTTYATQAALDAAVGSIAFLQGNDATGQVNVVAGSPASSALTFAYTGTAAADAYTLVANADNVTMLAGNDTLTISAATAAPTGALMGGDGTTDTITLTAAANISGANISGFEVMNGNFAATMTAAQYASMAVTNTVTVTLSGANTGIVAQTTSPVLTLANGTNTVDATGTANYNLTGGTGADTFNFGAALTAGDTVAGGTGTDVLTVTGAATGSANITAIETIQVNYATAATFTTGAIAPGVASTITAAGSTAAVTLDASLYNATTSLTIIDGQGNDTITVPTAAAERDLTTVTLSTGGADQIIIKNTAAATTTNEVTINNFTTGVAAGADTIDFMMTNGTVNHTSYQVVTAAATNELATASIIEIESAAGTVTSFDAGNAGLVETLIASAIGNSASGTSGYIVYGSGASAGKAALYEVVSTAGGADTTTANITVELVAVFNNVTADSFVIGNFA